MNMRATAKVLGTALAATGLLVSAGSAHAGGSLGLKCRQTLTKESSKLTQSLAKVLQKCEQAVHDGKLPGPCPDAKSAATIAKSKSSLGAKIVAACTGATGEFAFGRCPNETNTLPGVCTNILIQSEADIGTCLSCLADQNATQLVHTVLYGSLIPPVASGAAKCQSTVGKSTTAFYIAKSKAMAKCQDGVLKGKVTGACPDAATTAAIAKAESKKVASITKDCCGADGVCGGNTCDATIQPVICSDGANFAGPCSPSCAGGANAGVACTVDSQCPGGACNGSGDAQCASGFTCVGTAAGDACEVASDCGRCRGGTTPGLDCRSNGECHSNPGACDTSINHCVGGSNDGDPCALKCKGGANNGTVCSVASECPGGACNGAIDCPSIGGGTCVGVSGHCTGSDDLRPIEDLGYPHPNCPGLTAGGAAIELMGQSGVSLLQCVDTQADSRANCQIDAGASFLSGGLIPPNCLDAPVECAADGGMATVTVSFASAVNLDGLSISLGYKGVLLPGTGDVPFPGPVTSLDGSAIVAANDTDDAVVVSIVDPGGFAAGPIFTVQFSTCSGMPTTANFGCVVRSASDTSDVTLLEGVSCSVTSIM